MLLELFTEIHPLMVLLQSSGTKLCLHDVPGYLNGGKASLGLILNEVEHRKYLTFEKLSIADNSIQSLPPASRIRRPELSWDEFERTVFPSFLLAFINELECAFDRAEFWACFDIFDPRSLPNSA